MKHFKLWSLVVAGLLLLNALPAEDKKTADQPLSVEELKKSGIAPTPVSLPPPQYPRELEKKGITGSVLIEFIINARGEVSEARVIESTNKGFENVTLAAVSKWKFRPGELNGRRVSTRATQRLYFSLEKVKK